MLRHQLEQLSLAWQHPPLPDKKSQTIHTKSKCECVYEMYCENVNMTSMKPTNVKIAVICRDISVRRLSW